MKKIFLIQALALSSFAMTGCLHENLSQNAFSDGDVTLSLFPSVDGSLSRAEGATSSSPYEGTSMSVTLWYQYDNNSEYNQKFVEFNKTVDVWAPKGGELIFLKKNDGTDKTKFSVYVTAPAVDDPGNEMEDIPDDPTYVGKVLKDQKFTIKSDQSNESNFIASDLASYNGEGLDPDDYPDGRINVSLTHRLSLLKIRITGEDTDLGQVSDVKVKSRTNVVFTTKSKPSPTLDETDNSEADITPLKVDDEYHVILPPQEITDKEFITLKIGGTDYVYKVPAEVTHKLETQKSYTLNLVAGDNKIELGGITVENWEAKEIALSKEREGSWSEHEIEVTASDKVYEVSNGGELYYALSNVASNNTVKLMNDIDLSAHYWEPVDISEGKSYTNYVTIDGNGKKITGLNIDATKYNSSTNASLFDASKYILIKDLTIDSPVLVGSSSTTNAGVLLSNVSSGAGIYNCVVKGASISGNFASSCNLGGLAGTTSGGSAIVGCIFEGNISTSLNITTSGSLGGIVGKAGKSMIVACYSVCDFTGAQANTIGLFSGKKGGSATSANTVVTACIYKGSANYKPLGSEPTDYYKCESCQYDDNTVLTLDELNQAINGEYGYGGSNDASGPANGTCIMLSTKETYQYNFATNDGEDKDTYPYIVKNVAQ